MQNILLVASIWYLNITIMPFINSIKVTISRYELAKHAQTPWLFCGFITSAIPNNSRL